MIVSVIGLGKVGSALAAVLAANGFDVIGVDSNARLVENVNSRKICSFEPGVIETFNSIEQERFLAVTDIEFALQRSEVSFIILPTPSLPNGKFSLEYLMEVFFDIGKALHKKETYHLISLVSTVIPGDSLNELIPVLERHSGKRCGVDFGFCYNPAFIALGEVMKGFSLPEYVIVGSEDELSAGKLMRIHQKLVKNSAPILKMNLLEAEITKIASNSWSTLQVSFANMLCALSNQLGHVNVDVITSALGNKRSPLIYRGAVPYGGPCWPRDNIAFSALLKELAVSNCLPASIDDFNQWYAQYILNWLLENSEERQAIAIIGLAYKQGVPFIDDSFSCWLAGQLIQSNRRVSAWDPLVKANKAAILPQDLDFEEDLANCLNKADAALIINYTAYLDEYDWTKHDKLIVIDCWRKLPIHIRNKLGSRYIPLGNHQLQGESREEVLFMDTSS